MRQSIQKQAGLFQDNETPKVRNVTPYTRKEKHKANYFPPL